MPTAAKPPPIIISSREDGEWVVFELKPGLGQPGQPVPIMKINKFFLDMHPWLFAQQQLLAYKIGQDILESLGYKSDIKQVGGTVQPANESTIITDPPEQKQ